MDLAPCNEVSRQWLVSALDNFQANEQTADYIVKLFPNVLLDVARVLIEQATFHARQPTDEDPAEAIKQQLKPFFAFGFLLGKCPQITSLMYSYFEQSSFQPLPEEFFKLDKPSSTTANYTYAAFDDDLTRDILKTYFKYLVFNPKLFSSIWNWSELGRIVAQHPNDDLKYLAMCCLSIITRPDRFQHMSKMQVMFGGREDGMGLHIELQIKYCPIYVNSFTPVIESDRSKAEQLLNSIGRSETGYSFDTQTLAKVANILLLKHDNSSQDHKKNIATKLKTKSILNNFVAVETLDESISKIAYAASINKPCLLRGPPGCGKTSIIDYIAAQTNRVEPPAYVRVQIGDQIDSKLIVGSYVCTEIPGQFEWRPGPLTQAMTYGSWIVFEDIDSAPSELAQVIHSVIENGNLSCVSCCPIRIDSPHPEFRIFFTQQTRDTSKSLKLGFNFIERLCDIVDLPLLSEENLREVISKRYKFASDNSDLIDKIIHLYSEAERIVKEINLSRAPRVVTLRDLFKFCDRVAASKIRPSSVNKYSSNDLDVLLSETIDCFISFLPMPLRVTAAKKFGQILGKPSSDIEGFLLQRKPDLRIESDVITVGRARLEITANSKYRIRSPLARTRQSVQLLESLSLCVKNREPVLLVGETGVGKTTLVQYLASKMNTDLVVLNLSQQSDSSDLIGGFRPVDMREVMKPINEKFTTLFKQTFIQNENKDFLDRAEELYLSSEWPLYIKLIYVICGKALDRATDPQMIEKWRDLLVKARRLSRRISNDNPMPMALSFAEGTLLRSVRRGCWLLLDEVNLAEPDVLQCLILVLDSLRDSHVYMQGMDYENEEVIEIHPNFRIFACMNPSTDVGKRDLPISTRARFTEFYLDDINERHELRLIVESYVKACLKTNQIESIVQFYQEIRNRASTLSDISGNSPVYSLRTLCRTLTVCALNVCRDMEKSLFESLMITFIQQLNAQSVTNVLKLMESTINKHASIQKIITCPIQMPQDDHQYVEVEGFWIQTSSQKKIENEDYIITKSVRENLKRICRIISLGQRRLPILIQGNTSVGKTSLIKYLAKLTGNFCFRINNHEHTDLQDYVGRYVLRESGDLQFQEGLLVTAMRKGYWVILDELNLAPCDLLEALNRVLDDNRELFIPETRECIHAHSKFMLFATQNPPEQYSGRKTLSRAFRNRFIELNFDEIPSDELEEILHRRCKMPPQYAKKIVSVMKELQLVRRESVCFSGKSSFMTMRDLFRWGDRYRYFKDTIPDNETLDWEDFLASEGLILLEGRVRTLNESEIVKAILEKVFRRALDRSKIYSLDTQFDELKSDPKFKHISLTEEYKRFFVQMSRALKYREPVLLCGQTGCGKTTACQLHAKLTRQQLITYNCHLNTECSDFIGNVRPSRYDDDKGDRKQKFPWMDGPLIQAMRKGHIFLMDEISLADDAVLERINSVLEPERSITLTEKDGTEISAREKFRFVATMNPGGDYGKKELSLALRNRFTEIYCHNPMDINQVMSIVENSLNPSLLKPKILLSLIPVVKIFLKDYYRNQDVLSLRDILSLTKFINATTSNTQLAPLPVQQAMIDGADLVFFDQFGTCGHKASHADNSENSKLRLRSKLERLVESKFGKTSIFLDEPQYNPASERGYVKIANYFLKKGTLAVSESNSFIFDAPSVKANQLKVIRALQLDRPVLLEGDPGAGKTSIVTALASITGHQLTRINLSEQTDISDLFGSDLPDASDLDSEKPKFRWHDGPLLRAIKDSHWVLLDEMNLASQSVLEGLNACFDHRGEIFIPELDKKFSVDRSTTRIFACQNPYSQGASRKGLPQSFLNRFTSIYVEAYQSEDLVIILKKLYPNLNSYIIEKMVEFNENLNNQKAFDYEFNLRDLIYWCDLTTKYVVGDDFKKEDLYDPGRSVQFAYIDRLRTIDEKAEFADLFERVFGYPVYDPPYREVKLGEFSLILSRAMLQRKSRPPPHLFDLCILKYQMPYIESIAKAIELNKMPILVGESGSGKRSMIRILAGLTGSDLDIIAANRDMDTIELLGSFEQKSLQREMVDLVQDANKFITSLINSISRAWSWSGQWIRLYKHIWSTLYANFNRDLKLSKNELMNTYRFQLQQMDELVSEIGPLSGDNKNTAVLKTLKDRVKSLTKKLLYYSESTYSSGNFEWIDSALIKSMKQGRWLMIENANLMNPATLDRLNSLVEPNGYLALSEKGSGPDGIETLKPHPNFRLILTMNPEYGELSRAMRNRGAEIYVRTRFYFEDFLMLLRQNGFKPRENTACLSYCIMQTCYDTHLKITGETAEQDGALLAYFGLNYLSTMAQQIRRGVPVDEILSSLLLSYYNQKGFLESNTDETVLSYVVERMRDYRSKYVVDLNDERYKWCNFMHDLVFMTGGDANMAMLMRENKLFWDTSDPIASGLLKADEIVDCLDIVNTCISVKIFMELSTQADFDYRRGFIKDTFTSFPKFMNIVNRHVDSLHQDCMPLINSQLPISEIIPVSEMYVDTRNSPDLHYYLQSIDYKGTIEREDIQNRWLLSLHRVTIKMIVDLMEDRSLDNQSDSTSLWLLSEQFHSGEILKEDLVRPPAELAVDLHDFLIGILRVVGDRCFDNIMVPKMLARFFWIGYFLGKLKKGYSKTELIAVCNQIPMLWTLTYQKIIVPMIKDCDLADLSYNNRKFSDRIKQICDFLDVNVSKPSHLERSYYNKIINLHAATSKRYEIVSREIDRFFNALLVRYTLKSQQSVSLGSDNLDVLTASGLVWSNSQYLPTMYKIQDMMILMESIEEDFETIDRIKTIFNDARKMLQEKKLEHVNHECGLRKDSSYRTKLVAINRRRSALDQFSPIWQLKFIHLRLSQLCPLILPAKDVLEYRDPLRKMLHVVNGVMMSPRYYSSLMKFFKGIEACLELQNTIQITANTSLGEENSIVEDRISINRRHLDIYVSFLVDHLMENIVLDHQVVGWTKMRVSTSDLSSTAPLIPEYAPIISLVSSYCLDMAHLKLNSYQNPSPQLDSMLIYLWRAYAIIKSDQQEDMQDVALARNLIHARCSGSEELEILIGDHRCSKPSAACQCLDVYLRRRNPKFDEMMTAVREQADKDDVTIFKRSIKLLYFGFYNMLEYAPIFTMDPSLRSREKLEVYKSELAHIKLDLHQRNTLYYWKTGENFRLLDISPEEAKLYPFSTRVLVERRCKLERSIKKLKKDYTNRPKSDDGTLYNELRKEVEITINRYTKIAESLVTEIISYLATTKPSSRIKKLTQLNIKCRMLIKSIETTIARFRSDYVLYSDLTTSFLVGLCFMSQGLRRLYSRLEPKMQICDMGFLHASVDRFSNDIMRVFSFTDFTLNNLNLVTNKRAVYSILNRICPPESISHVQSLLLKSILLQLNHHIKMTPSDMKQCIPIVRNVADKFHKAWLERKNYMEEQRRKQEDLYQYKTSVTSLGNDPDFQHREFIEICTKFPIYDHVYQDTIVTPAEKLSADEQNLTTEAKIINLNRSVDLTMCIDICKAHYKFMREASLKLLGQQDSTDIAPKMAPIDIDMNQLIKSEAEILYTIMRKCSQNFDRLFDSLSLECHLLQASQLINMINRDQTNKIQVGSLSSSIEILDEDIFDIYHDPDVKEALRLQEFNQKLDQRVNSIQSMKGYDAHPLLNSITHLTTKISSFLITEPLMKFITGAHMLVQHIDEWNRLKLPRECKLTGEFDELIDLIKHWREIEVKCWRSSLHRVKKKYIDDTLCELWFQLYEAFNDPISSTKKKLVDNEWMYEEDDLSPESQEFYSGFSFIIKEFLESATLGDYQIRLDLVFAFAIQTRFAGLFEQAKSCQSFVKAEEATSISRDGDSPKSTQEAKIDYERLTTYVYNIHRLYQGLMEPLKDCLAAKEKDLGDALNQEIRIVNWQGRNAWEIKTQFRISHKKLNSVMNKYLEVLKDEALKHQQDDPTKRTFNFEVALGGKLPSDELACRYSASSNIVDAAVNDRSFHKPDNLASLMHGIDTIRKMGQFSRSVFEISSKRYSAVIEALESSIDTNKDSIDNFYSHKVDSMVIHPKDSKQIKEEKMKTCRQMYQSKKFAMQAIFKNLQELGASYQRGLNNHEACERLILSLEPLRGMVQNQCSSIMRTASHLVPDALVTSCNNLYREFVPRQSYFFGQARHPDLSGDQVDRMQGYVHDMTIDILIHTRNAALLYKHLMDIHASTTRLNQLKDLNADNTEVIVFNFRKVHRVVQIFDELVGRTVSSFAKFDLLMDCFATQSKLLNIDDETSNTKHERAVLRDLISEIDEKHALMTTHQFDHINRNLDQAKKDLALISAELRDKLKYTVRSHLYGQDDLEHLQQLFQTYLQVLEHFLPENAGKVNSKRGTIMGSMNLLLLEAREKVAPLLEDLTKSAKPLVAIDSVKFHNLNRIDLRLKNLLKQAKLAIQQVYKNETEFTNTKVSNESLKRRMKPFNHIDSGQLRDSLRPQLIIEQVAKCFMTINIEDRTDIKSIVCSIAPILQIYTQNFACYLNVILLSLHLKLLSANQLTPFFTNLLCEGFGLPMLLKDLDNASDGKQTNSQSNGDNAGFGEGEGKSDASKKIELESQLDDLKNGDNQKDQNNEGDDDGQLEDSIKPSDDGIEMTDDFDAKAQGPENKSVDDGDDADENSDDQNMLDELDKQFDEVDQDEGQLDHQLWDQKDEEKPSDVDDEIDLRQAEADDMLKPEMEDIDLMAKNEDLKQSSETSNNREKETSTHDANDSEIGDAGQNLDEVSSISDLDEEAFNQSFEDMSATADMGIDLEDEVPDGADPDEHMGEEDRLETVTPIDEDRLETVTPIDEDLEDISDDEHADNSKQDVNKTSDTLNEDISEEIPIDSDCPDHSLSHDGADQGMDEREMDPSSRGKGEQRSLGAKLDGDNDDDEGADKDRAETIDQGDAAEKLGAQEIVDEKASSQTGEDDTAGKRTLAAESFDENKPIKRQKIEPAKSQDGEDKRDIPCETDDQAVRHLKMDTDQAIEVVDLLDSDDESSLDAIAELERHVIESSSSRRQLPSKKDEAVDLDKNQVSPFQTSDDEGGQSNKIYTTYNTNLGLLKYITCTGSKEEENLTATDNDDIMTQIDKELSASKSSSEHESIEMDKLTKLWSECTRHTNHLVHELCQQLQIVLQPTKMSKYRGDYKTGKRLNMRKIISYIASQYRKDKIWLRRTKPSKRTYNISLAVDNSSSMSENNCRSMTYQSLALLAHSLSLIEVGALNVVKFGEAVKCIHEFGQPYMDAIGAQWLKELRFNEKRTSYSKLLKFSCEAFEKQAEQSYYNHVEQQNSHTVHQLLIVLSDGRNVTSEQEEVKRRLRDLKSLGVLTLFIIIDDSKQNGGKSILDLKSCVPLEGSGAVLRNYMDAFPFPFYVLLRQLETMPSILGDALRQWFELVSSMR